MRAAIYARKSTEQQVEDVDKSVTRQVALAKAFAAEKKWSVVGEYVDDGVSGVLTTKLTERAKMLAAAADEQFDVLVVRDVDRLSRNDEELPGLIYTLRDAGVEGDRGGEASSRPRRPREGADPPSRREGERVKLTPAVSVRRLSTVGPVGAPFVRACYAASEPDWR